MAETIYLLTGSNMGDREKSLEEALEHISAIPGLEMIATSALYLSEAQGMKGENPSFINQVIMADYDYIPLELLDALEKIERSMGRSEKGMLKARNIDIDILLFGEQKIDDARLTIPHKEMLKRPFALIPLVQINPELTHPVTKKFLSDYIKPKDKEKVVLYKDHVARNI